MPVEIKPYRRALALAAALALLSGSPRGHAYEERSPEPTADYPSLLAARDSIGAIIGRVVREGGDPRRPGIRVSREPVRFRYWYAGDSTDGWAYHIVVTDSSGCPGARLERALGAAGWSAHHAYIADGPDGGIVGLVSKRYFCVVEGRWDGGDDSDSTYVPDLGCEVTVTCVPRRLDDVPR